MKIKIRSRFYVSVVNEFTGKELEHAWADTRSDAEAKYDVYKRAYAKDTTEYKKKRIASDYTITLVDFKDQANNMFCHIYTDRDLNIKLEQVA